MHLPTMSAIQALLARGSRCTPSTSLPAFHHPPLPPLRVEGRLPACFSLSPPKEEPRGQLESIHVVGQVVFGGFFQGPRSVSTGFPRFFHSLASPSARRAVPQPTAAGWVAPANPSAPGAASVRPRRATRRLPPVLLTIETVWKPTSQGPVPVRGLHLHHQSAGFPEYCLPGALRPPNGPWNAGLDGPDANDHMINCSRRPAGPEPPSG